MKQPVIGITLDHETAPSYAFYPWYALRENYVQAIQKTGGIPVLLPYAAGHIARYLEMIDGLLIPGGGSDINPQIYGCQERHPSVVTKDHRTEFELKMVESALKKDLPVFGICGGQQILNVVLGGTLIQHIPDRVPGCLAHEQKRPKHETSHAVTIAEGTLLRQILKAETIEVNSTHHQAVDKTGAGACINAWAVDGVIEGIEAPNQRFCLGVQWHPEYLSTPHDQALFKAFVEAAAPVITTATASTSTESAESATE